MYNKIFKRSDFAGNILTLMTGATIAQAIPITISPILTRLYSPEDFGVLALFISIVTIFSTIISARYELAIIIPEDDADAVNILALCFIIIISISIFLFLIVCIFNDLIAHALGNEKIGAWLYLMPVTALLMGLYNSLRYFSIRSKDFKSIAISRTVKSTFSAVIKILSGLLSFGFNGLIAGELFAHFSGNGAIIRNLLKRKELFKYVSIDNIRVQAKKFSNFPKFSMFSGIANALSMNLNTIFINKLFSTGTVGQYSLVQKIVSIPLNLIGRSVSDVYFQKASEDRKKTGNAKNIFVKTSITLFLLSIPVVVILFFFGEDLFAFVFGESWRIAGKYSKILVFLFSIRFVASPLTVTFSVFEKQKYSLFLMFIQLIFIITVYTIAWIAELDIERFLMVYTGFMFLFYFIMYIITFRVAAKGDNCV